MTLRTPLLRFFFLIFSKKQAAPTFAFTALSQAASFLGPFLGPPWDPSGAPLGPGLPHNYDPCGLLTTALLRTSCVKIKSTTMKIIQLLSNRIQQVVKDSFI
jgi:hypothetical protein